MSDAKGDGMDAISKILGSQLADLDRDHQRVLAVDATNDAAEALRMVETRISLAFRHSGEPSVALLEASVKVLTGIFGDLAILTRWLHGIAELERGQSER